VRSWRRSGGDFTGVVGTRVFALRQTPTDTLFRLLPLRPAPGAALAPPPATAADALAARDVAAAALREYLALDIPLAPLHAAFSAADARFAALAPYLLGARLLRQDPCECLFAFICSSNNHVQRIAGMVERLCAAYGTCLGAAAAEEAGATAEGVNAAGATSAAPAQVFYAFPTAAQLARAEESALRGLGFGYRAKVRLLRSVCAPFSLVLRSFCAHFAVLTCALSRQFIVGTASALAAHPAGGAAYLASLRAASTSSAAAAAALRLLPGVGPKVAACVALFALNKHDIVPVDTHVWQLALAHYTPELRGTPEAPATLTKAAMAAVEASLIRIFGPFAGWAHTALFVAELRGGVRETLPAHLRTPQGATPAAAARAKKAAREAREAEGGAAVKKEKKARPTKRKLEAQQEEAAAAVAAAVPAS
jgi:N-glycosylase/DNA lyase